MRVFNSNFTASHFYKPMVEKLLTSCKKSDVTSESLGQSQVAKNPIGMTSFSRTHLWYYQVPLIHFSFDIVRSETWPQV